jgi:hypothetical protein
MAGVGSGQGPLALEGNDQEGTISAEFNESAIVASVDQEKGGKRRKYMLVSVHSTKKKATVHCFDSDG